MNLNPIHLIRQWLIPVCVVGLVLVLGIVNNLLGAVTAIKGGYVLIGVLLAGVAFYATVDANDHATFSPAGRYERRLGTTVFIICSLSIAFAGLARSRLVVLVFALPLGYLLLIVQMRSGTSPRWYLLQTGALFFTATLSKFLAVGYYFGAGDIIGHIRSIEQLIQVGSPSAITSPVYQQVPGLHVLVGSLKMITGLPTYDSLLLLGSLVYLGLVVVLFATVRATGASERLAVCTVIAMTVLERVLFYTTYFYPQSLATAFAVLLIFIAFRARIGARTRLAVAATILASTLVFTHHFTIFLFAPLILVLFLVQPISRLTGLQTRLSNDLVIPRAFPIIIVGLSALAYWALYNIFIGQFIYAVNELILGQTLLTSSTTNIVSTYTIGVEVSLQTPAAAMLSLFTPSGLYYIAAMGIFMLGVLETLSLERVYRRLLALIVTGIAAAPFVLKTPIAISQRIALPASFFFAVVLGIGIRRLLRGRHGLVHQRGISVFMLVLLCATGPMVAADDVGALDAGPDFYGKTTGPGPQRTLTDQEYAELQSTSRFLQEYNGEATSFWFTSVMAGRFGADVDDSASINNTTIMSDDKLLLYKQNWPRYQVNFRGARNKLFISKSSLNSIIQRENKVYTTGRDGLLWDRSKMFDPNSDRRR